VGFANAAGLATAAARRRAALDFCLFVLHGAETR